MLLSTATKTRSGSEAIDLWGKKSDNSRVQVVLWDRAEKSCRPSQSMLWHCVYLICINRWGIRIQIAQSARRNGIQSGSGSERQGKGHWISNWEISCCVPIEWRLRGKDMGPGHSGGEEEWPLYPWQIHCVTVWLFQVFAILFSVRI